MGTEQTFTVLLANPAGDPADGETWTPAQLAAALEAAINEGGHFGGNFLVTSVEASDRGFWRQWASASRAA